MTAATGSAPPAELVPRRPGTSRTLYAAAVGAGTSGIGVLVAWILGRIRYPTYLVLSMLVAAALLALWLAVRGTVSRRSSYSVLAAAGLVCILGTGTGGELLVVARRRGWWAAGRLRRARRSRSRARPPVSSGGPGGVS